MILLEHVFVLKTRLKGLKISTVFLRQQSIAILLKRCYQLGYREDKMKQIEAHKNRFNSIQIQCLGL